MPWRSDSDFTYDEQKRRQREKQKKHECMKAKQSMKARESHKARNQVTKHIFCSISDLYALCFFGNFPIIQLNNINPYVI